MALTTKFEERVARACEKRQYFVFSSKVAFLLEKKRFFHVVGFTEVMLPFAEEYLEEGLNELKVCWKISLSRLSIQPGSNFFGKTPLFFRYSGVNVANAVNLQAKRR